MKKLFFKMVDFWSNDRSFSVVLSILIVVVFILFPLKSIQFPIAEVLINCFLTVLLISGVFAVSTRKSIQYPAMIFGIVALTIKWLNEINYDQILTRIDFALSVIYFSALLLIILRKVFEEGEVTARRIEGAIAAYLIIAILFMYIYQIIFSFIPDSFTFSFRDAELSVETVSGHFLYFSVVTLTTLGYGDVTAFHPFGRSCVMLEALIGQLYPAILIARLVSMEIETQKKSGNKNGDE